MFERFRRPRGADASEGSVATREREASTAPETTVAPGRDLGDREDRTGTARFDREPAAGEPALDRDHARDDLARDDTAGRDDALTRNDSATPEDTVTREDDEHTSRGHAIAVGGATAAGAAAVHHHETEREEAAREDDLAARDDDHPADFDRTHAGDPAADREGGLATGAATTRVHDLDRDGVDDRVERHEPVLAPAALDTMRARQRDRFGGIQWGADFFGWLCAIGLASLLTAALVGAGVALGLSTDDAANADTAPQIGLGGGIALIAVLAIAWFCGGYVAGRMARFDGVRQGLGVWLWTLLSAVVIAAVAAIGGTEYDVYQRLNLPRIAIGDSTLNTGGAIAGAVAVVATLLFAVLGGKAGERFHKRVDRVATDEYVVER
jgi:hypothetical protein